MRSDIREHEIERFRNFIESTYQALLIHSCYLCGSKTLAKKIVYSVYSTVFEQKYHLIMNPRQAKAELEFLACQFYRDVLVEEGLEDANRIIEEILKK